MDPALPSPSEAQMKHKSGLVYGCCRSFVLFPPVACRCSQCGRANTVASDDGNAPTHRWQRRTVGTMVDRGGGGRTGHRSQQRTVGTAAVAAGDGQTDEAGTTQRLRLVDSASGNEQGPREAAMLLDDASSVRRPHCKIIRLCPVCTDQRQHATERNECETYERQHPAVHLSESTTSLIFQLNIRVL